jgi:uncharacterized repeat protein (TIGR03803 family)
MKSRLLLAVLFLPLLASAQTYTYSTLVNFPPVSNKGPADVIAPLIIDSAGNLYGASLEGGAHDSCCGGDGMVFKVSAKGVFTPLHYFNAAAGDGAQALANVVRDSAGNLYGTTEFGGTHSGGTVFKLSPSGEETILHSFTGGTDGNFPFNAVTLDGKGNIYGYVFLFQDGDQTGNGKIYKIAKDGTFSIAYDFSTGFGANGADPVGSMILGRDGNFYGVTHAGGSNTVITAGTIFKFTPQNQLTTLHVFPYDSTTDVESPGGKLTQNAEGEMFGGAGFASGGSAIYEIDASGNESVFTACCSGSQYMVIDKQGNLYGIISDSNTGTFSAYQVTPGGAVETLYTFAQNLGGIFGLAIDTQGNLYGTTSQGGHGNGSVFKLTKHN